jgi:hypothetical protein
MTAITQVSNDSIPANDQTSSLVDQIGTMKARLAPLLNQLKELEAALKAYGEGRYLGSSYEAKVFVQQRDTLDMKAVRDHLSRQFIAAHTNTSDVTVLKVTARQISLAPVEG